MNHPIYTCIWLDNQAQEAAEYYCRIFKKSKILSSSPVVVEFEINNQKFMLLNGNSQFKFNDAISFVLECDSQDEIDYYWEQLTDEGQESMCGWLKDKYGISWQVVPKILPELIKDPNKTDKIMKLFQNTIKFNIQELLDL